jgi:hypothetical protein
MLRLIVNKAKHHFNQALELAERGHDEQAIVELRNALDLDASLVDARVVLGTLFAKQENFDEARRYWAEALALDHRFEKAHDYLAKAQVLDTVLPAMKKQQRTTYVLAGGFAIMLLITVGLVVFNFIVGWGLAPVRGPGRGPGRDRDQARPFVANVGSVPDNQAASAPPTVASQSEARLLQGHIEELESERLDLAGAALANDDPALALEMTARVKTNPEVMEKLGVRVDRVQGQALDRLVAKANAAADLFFAGKLDQAAFADKADAWIKLAGDAPQAKALAQARDKVDRAATERLLADANAKIAHAPLAEATRVVIDLHQQRPGLAKQLDAALDLRLNAEEALLTGQVKQMTDKGQFAQARERVAEMGLAYRLANRAANAGRVEALRLGALRRDIDRQEALRKLADAEAALDAKQWQACLDLAAAVDAKALDAPDQDRLTRRRAEAERALADADWQWFQGLDPQFADGRVSVEDARRATAIYRRTIANLPPATQYARGAILFYAASAYWTLGQMDQAAARVKELEAMGRLPGYVKASLKQFLAAHGKDLGLPATTPAAPKPKATDARQQKKN